MIVDSRPTSDGPPSRTMSESFKYSPISSLTDAAFVGETWPNLFALGAATPAPPPRQSAADGAAR